MNQRPNRVDRGVRCGGCLMGSSPRSVRFQFVGKVGNFWLQPMGQEPTPISLTVRQWPWARVTRNRHGHSTGMGPLARDWA
jgi:hypothetical protein